jgi:hypothetical protein
VNIDGEMEVLVQWKTHHMFAEEAGVLKPARSKPQSVGTRRPIATSEFPFFV